jgi:hypothetical protein
MKRRKEKIDAAFHCAFVPLCLLRVCGSIPAKKDGIPRSLLPLDHHLTNGIPGKLDEPIK